MIYSSSDKSAYDTSIGLNEEEDDDDDMGVAPAGGRPTYSAPADLLNNVPSNEQLDDPFAANRQKRILERMDDYHLRQRRHLFYSPMRQDPFADGGKTPDPGKRTFADVMQERDLKRDCLLYTSPSPRD